MKELDTPSQDKTPKKTWSKRTRIGENTTEVTVEEISNGYLITTWKSWEDSEGKYHSNETKAFSKENPLENDIDSEKPGKQSIESLYKGLFGGSNLLDV